MNARSVLRSVVRILRTPAHVVSLEMFVFLLKANISNDTTCAGVRSMPSIAFWRAADHARWQRIHLKREREITGGVFGFHSNDRLVRIACKCPFGFVLSPITTCLPRCHLQRQRAICRLHIPPLEPAILFLVVMNRKHSSQQLVVVLKLVFEESQFKRLEVVECRKVTDFEHTVHVSHTLCFGRRDLKSLHKRPDRLAVDWNTKH